MKLEARVQNAVKAERRRKQEYLKEKIIGAGNSPEDFHAFIVAQKASGDEVDNWTLEELESQVECFEYQRTGNTPLSLPIFWRHNEILFKRVSTTQLGRSALTQSFADFNIKSAQAKSLGIFRPTVPCYTFCVTGFQEVVRFEEHFEWLSEAIEREFPFTATPPPPSPPRSFDKHFMEAARQSHEQYLRDCLAHSSLRHSLALELFLTVRSPKEFVQKSQNFLAFLDRSCPATKAISRKTFEAADRDFLAGLPTVSGEAEIKFSPVVEETLLAAPNRLGLYQGPIGRLERLAPELNQHLTNFLAVNAQILECLRELCRPGATAANPVMREAELSCLEPLTAFFEQLGTTCNGLVNRFDREILSSMRRLRDYSQRIALKGRARDSLLNDLRAWRRDLAHRTKTLSAEPRAAEPQTTREISPMALLEHETVQFQRFADLCGYVNVVLFRDIAHFDEYAARAMLTAVSGIAAKGINEVLRAHEMYACAKFDVEHASSLLGLS